MSVTEFPCFSLSRFKRKPELTPVEKAALAIWYEKWLIPFSKREELELPFQRLVEPIMAALRHANYHTERELRRALSLILVAVHRWQRTYWVWTDEEWMKVMLEIGTEDRIVKQPRNQSVRQLLTCACLLRGPEILFSIPRIAHLQDMAGNILGREAVQEAVTTMQQKGISLGISPKTVHENMPAYLCEALLLCRSAKLSDLTVDVFEKLKAKYSSGSRLMRRSYLPVTRILYNLGSIPHPIEYENLKFKVQHGVDDNLHPDWLAWVDRWFETAVTSRVTRKGQRRQLTKVGRWFTTTYPGLTSPTQWNRDIAAAYVATVCEMNVGDWIHPKAHVHMKDKYPKPMEPLSKAALLSAVRVFFGNCQEWGWMPRNFDANRSLELPRSIARLIGPDPRDIPRDHWAKLMNAGLSLTRADIPSADISIRNGYHKESSITWYPFEMVKAIAIVWLFAGLRANEIQRLRVGCTRLQEPEEEQNQKLPAKPVCMLDVPVSKTGTAFSKPVDPVVGEITAAWEAIRPETAKLVDLKTGELVHFLFIWRGKRASKNYINKGLIPLLCKKAGVPEYDARGPISSHRARATIASQLYNAPNGMDTGDLQHWLGHSTPQSTVNYIRPYVSKLSKAYSDAEFFAQNVRMIDVIVDREAVQSGAAAAGQPWLMYDLGHGLCGNPVYDTCAHRMACAKCDFYTPKASAYAQMLEAKEGITRMKHTLTLQPEEEAALDGDEKKLDELLAKLENVPTPQGPTPRELHSAGPAGS